MEEVILAWWVKWVLGGLAGALLTWLRMMWRKQKATENGIRALLRDRLVQAYYHHTERGWITLHGLENVNALYKEYHALGGNGTVTKLVEDLHSLEVRDRPGV